jgi:uracil-DNA glycosylase
MLLDEVRLCNHCDDLQLPFEMASHGGRAFRFPPTIGATATAPLLFVGINPRVSDSNRDLHSALWHDPSAFSELAGNRFQGRTYIGEQGLERHYAAHVCIAHEVFPDQLFENVGVVTELFFCASESSRGLPVEHSPCAERYFERVLAIVQPQVVFAVGRRVENYLVRRYGVEARKGLMKWGVRRLCPIDRNATPEFAGREKIKVA